jgi:hypothetical protein
MTMSNDTRSVALERLHAFIGDWRMDASIPLGPAANAGSSDENPAYAVFEWALGGQFVIQRSTAPRPAPDNLAIIGFDSETQRYSQHYFDSRGVVRVYAMTFTDGVWTLLRDQPDFSPLEFSQRFTGTFGDDGNSIAGRWEMSMDGSTWSHDFDLRFSKVLSPESGTNRGGQ